MESVAIEGEKGGVSAEKKDPIGLIDNSCLICALGVLDHAGQWLHVLELLKWGIVRSTRARFKTDGPSQTFDFVLRPYTKWSKIKYCSSSNAPGSGRPITEPRSHGTLLYFYSNQTADLSIALRLW